MGKGRGDREGREPLSLHDMRTPSIKPPSAPQRARGSVVGLAAADALGGTLEFMSPDSIQRQYGQLREIVGGGCWGLRPGQWTDDTAMAVCLSRAMVEAGGYDLQTVIKHYVDWYDAGPFDIGGTCAAALSQLKHGVSPEEASYNYHVRSGGNSAGNGTLMRCAPIAVRYFNDPQALEKYTRMDSRLTHWDPMAAEACVYFNRMLAAMIANPDSDEVPEVPLPEDERVREAALATPEEAAERAATQGGFVLAALAVGTAAVRHATSFEEGVVWAANLGGDTDTNAAVAGALLGARFGADAMPKQWREQVEYREQLDRLGEHLYLAAQGKTPARDPWPDFDWQKIFGRRPQPSGLADDDDWLSSFSDEDWEEVHKLLEEEDEGRR